VPPWLEDPVRELRARARRRLGIERLHERIDELQAQLRALEPGGWDRSRERWRGVQPDAGLTWGQELSGDAFIAKISEYGAFHPGTRILEIGPGYGRLLKACLDLGVPFSEYVGLDISATNIEHLRERFADQRTSFFVGDAESADLEHRYDLLVSSLVFKHLYPTFEATLSNCARMLEPGALACFDLIEGDHSMFDADRVTYIKCCMRNRLLARFDLDAHIARRHVRQLVRARVINQRTGVGTDVLHRDPNTAHEAGRFRVEVHSIRVRPLLSPELEVEGLERLCLTPVQRVKHI
jgi:SAM-dependent methyltransferase